MPYVSIQLCDINEGKEGGRGWRGEGGREGGGEGGGEGGREGERLGVGSGLRYI